MAQPSIVTLTLNPTVDKSTSVDRISADAKLYCAKPSYDPGGGGINASRAIARLGGKSKAYYLAGGLTGEILRHFLDREKIDHHPLPMKGWTRENLTVLETRTGRQFRFVMPGPEIKSSEWRRLLNAAARFEPDFIIGSGSLPPGVPADFYVRLIKKFKRRKTKIIIDTSGDALSSALHEGGIYLIKPNVKEMNHLAGRPLTSEKAQIAAARKIIHGKSCAIVVLSLGARGALLVTAEDQWKFHNPPVRVKSQIGAGDSMVGAMALAFSRGLSLLDAVRFGIAAGAAAVMSAGTGLCRFEETAKLFKRVRYNQA